MFSSQRIVAVILVLLAVVSCRTSAQTTSTRIDITGRTQLPPQTLFGAGDNKVELYGTITANSVFTLSGSTISVATNTAIQIRVTMQHNSTIVVRDMQFPASLVVAPSFAFASDTNATVRLHNTNISCTLYSDISSGMSSCATLGLDSFAFLVEAPTLPKLTSSSPFSLAAARSLSRLEVRMGDGCIIEAVADASAASSSQRTLTAFSVQNTTSLVSVVPSVYQQSGVDRPSAPLSAAIPAANSLTLTPTLAVSISDSTFTCTSLTGRLSFLGCVQVGSGAFEWATGVGLSMLATAYPDAELIARFDASRHLPGLAVFVESFIVTRSTFTVTTENPMAVALSLIGAVFSNYSVIDGNNFTTNCAEYCMSVFAGVCEGASGWNPVSSATSTAIPTSATVTNGTSNHNGTAAPNPLSSSSSFSLVQRYPTFLVSDATFKQFQPVTELAPTAVFVSIAPVLRGVSSIAIRNVALHSRSHGANCELISFLYVRDVASGIEIGNIVADDIHTGPTYKLGLIEFSYVRYVPGPIYVRNMTTNIVSVNCDAVSIGIRAVLDFSVIRFELFDFTVTTPRINSMDQDVAGVWIAELRRGHSLTVSQMVFKLNSSSGIGAIFFDKHVVESISQLTFENMTCDLSAAISSNVLATNSTFINVSLILLRDVDVWIRNEAGDSRNLVASIQVFGPSDVILERCRFTVNGFVAAGITLFTLLDFQWWNPKPGDPVATRFTLRDSVVNCDSQGLAAGLLMTVVKKHDTVPNAFLFIEGVLPTKQWVPPIFLERNTFKVSGFIGGIFTGMNTRAKSIVMRSNVLTSFPARFFETSTLMMKLDGSAESLDLSASVNNSDNRNNNQHRCNIFNNKVLDSRSAIVTTTKVASASFLHFRGCGETSTSTMTPSETWYEKPYVTRTATNFSRTKSRPKSKSLSATESAELPPLNMETPAAAQALSSFASVGALIGGAGASVALDAARALAVLELSQRCRSFDATDKDMPMEVRRQKFVDSFLNLKTTPPENFFFICFGEARGRCKRGAILSSWIALTLAALFAIALGYAMRKQQLPFLTVVQREKRSIFTYARLPMFVGLLFSIVVGPWITTTVVFFAAPGLPAGDMVLAFLSVVTFLFIVISGFRIWWKHVNVPSSTMPRWIVEEALVDFSAYREQLAKEERDEREREMRRTAAASEMLLSSPDERDAPLDDDLLLLSGDDEEMIDLSSRSRHNHRNSSHHRNHNKRSSSSSTRTRRNNSSSGGARSASGSSRKKKSNKTTDNKSDKFSYTPPLKTRITRAVMNGLVTFLSSDAGRFIAVGDKVWCEISEATNEIPVPGGGPASVLATCGVLVMKFHGPWVREIETSSRNKDELKRLRDTATESVRSEIGGVPTRRFTFVDWRLRITPYYAFISFLWALLCCSAQGAALADPRNCQGSIIFITVINFLAAICDAVLRPFIVPLKTYAAIMCSTFLAIASAIAAFGGDASRNPAIADATTPLVYIALCVSTVMGLVNSSLKVFLALSQGGMALRSDVWRRLEAMMGDLVIMAGARATGAAGAAVSVAADAAARAAAALL